MSTIRETVNFGGVQAEPEMRKKIAEAEAAARIATRQ